MIILGMIGPWQIVLVVVVILLLFGGKKIPELMKGLGQGMKEFKNASKEDLGKSDGKSKNGNEPSNDNKQEILK